MDYLSRASRNPRLMKALTGLTVEEFWSLVPVFEQALAEKQLSGQRRRAPGGGRKGTLCSVEEKLFFILFYLRVYPTFDLAGFLFGGVDRSRPCRWVQTLLPLLEQTLGRTCVLPKRQIRSVEEFFQYFPGVQDLFIDGTERRAQRPKKDKNQRRRYSGKKKAHTRQNLVGCDEDKKILLLSPSKNGRLHDKRQLDKAGWMAGIPPGVTCWFDKGFEGVKGDNVMMPKKKPRKKELTDEEKENNRTISAIRMVNEHCMAGIKRYCATWHLYRNRKGQDDSFMLAACGLWNHHLKMA